MSSLEKANVTGVDVPIVQLTPLRKRTIGKKNYNKLLANIKTVGLIEPLCVCQEGEQFFILDGYIRYTVFLELGIDTVPCLVLPSRDLYTPNRQVNHLSSREENRMLRKALEKLDERTIAQAFGVESLVTRLHTSLYRELHPKVAAELKSNHLTQAVARELSFVLPKRQLEIVAMMKDSGDCSVAFAKAQVLATPSNLRSKKKRGITPWQRGHNTKRDLVKKLAEVEKHYDFYSALYRQYVGDLLKLAIYIRQIVSRTELRAYLSEHYPDDLQCFESVLAESEAKVVS